MRLARYLVVVVAVAVAVGISCGGRGGIPDTSRRTPTLPTITRLPEFPKIPSDAASWDKAHVMDLRRRIFDHKAGTYPESSSRARRTGRHTSTGLFSSFEPTEEQVKRIAPHYDNVLMNATRADVAWLFKKHNPAVTVFMYFAPGLTPGWSNAVDAGAVDEENTAWILARHPDWILKDAKGRLVQNASNAPISGAHVYWPDPGNREWQAFFAQKLNAALARGGSPWDGVLLDEFYGQAESFVVFGRANRQAKYPDTASFQRAQIDFLENVSAKVLVPIVANVEPAATALTPEFFLKVTEVAGGAENEVFPHESSVVADSSNVGADQLKSAIETINRAPRGKHIRLNAKPGGLAGDVDRTIYAYCVYLLVAGTDRQVHWTMKEGDSDFPHYWYREFDLDLGRHLGEFDGSGRVWKREFERATVVVNPHRSKEAFSFEGARVDILGAAVKSPVSLSPYAGMLLFRDAGALEKAQGKGGRE